MPQIINELLGMQVNNPSERERGIEVREGRRGVQATLYKQEISFVMQLAIYQLAFKKPLKPNPTNAKKAVNKRGKKREK